MLAVAKERVKERRLDNVETVHSGFLSYEHVGSPADFVYCRHALHQLPDFWKAMALRRIAAFLRPGGVLRIRDLFFSCDVSEVDSVIESWLDNAPPSSERGWTRAELATHLRDEYSTFTWLFEPMLSHAGFEIQEASYAASRNYVTYTCTAQSS